MIWPSQSAMTRSTGSLPNSRYQSRIAFSTTAGLVGGQPRNRIIQTTLMVSSSSFNAFASANAAISSPGSDQLNQLHQERRGADKQCRERHQEQKQQLPRWRFAANPAQRRQTEDRYYERSDDPQCLSHLVLLMRYRTAGSQIATRSPSADGSLTLGPRQLVMRPFRRLAACAPVRTGPCARSTAGEGTFPPLLHWLLTQPSFTPPGLPPCRLPRPEPWRSWMRGCPSPW